MDALYFTNLGSDDNGMIYATPGATGSLTSWDTTRAGGAGDYGDRDVAIVYGEGTAYFVPVATFNGGDGNDDIYILHHITVPAGGDVTLVHFVVLGGDDTGLTATDLTAQATAVDAIAAGIANHPSDAKYRDYLSDAAKASVTNF
ncbi:MAG: hypothetical protein QM767_06200 [Anaeromyxobacter sp.]